MMIRSVLTVCTANICRSPVAEVALRREMPDLNVGSAGVHALVGRDMDEEARKAAEAFGLEMPPHRARQLDDAAGRAADVILVMDRGHRETISRSWPYLVSKTFLIGQFLEGKEIPDPYRRGTAAHLRSAELIIECAGLWARQIEGMRG